MGIRTDIAAAEARFRAHVNVASSASGCDADYHVVLEAEPTRGDDGFDSSRALIAGIGGRFASLGIIGIMAGAITTHAPNGFFMNWFGALPAGVEGFEYHLLAIGLAAVVVLNGSGALSVDRWLTNRFDRTASPEHTTTRRAASAERRAA